MIDIGTKELANHFNFGSFSANFERLFAKGNTENCCPGFRDRHISVIQVITMGG
jgi:hypothetical protein